MKPIVSTNKGELNYDFIHQFLTNSYWAKGRTLEQVKQTIKNSMCFGIYLNDIQIGFARVVTDYTIYAHLMDVFINEQQRGKGFSKMLLTEIFNHPELRKVERWTLGTKDAHLLYKKFGFTEVKNPERMMVKITNK